MDVIRFEVDHREKLGQFVLTGSAVLPDTKEIVHSGTRRFSWINIRPMSLFESGDSSVEVSLTDLFAGKTEIDGSSNIDIDRLAFLVCRGGWPQALDMRDDITLEQAVDYYQAVVHADTRYFIDPSIAAASLDIGANDLVNDLKKFGFLFETLCVFDLRVFADALGGDVYHYKDKDGQKCDAVIHLRNGKYGLIKIKFGGDILIEDGAESLKVMREKLILTK